MFDSKENCKFDLGVITIIIIIIIIITINIYLFPNKEMGWSRCTEHKLCKIELLIFQ